MGDPRKVRKKYRTPAHPWQKARIDEESELISKYALSNKKEIWKMTSILKDFKMEAKKLSSLGSAQAEKEKKLLLKRLISMAILKPEDSLESILILRSEDIMERRLQTLVFKKGLAKSMKQARQFITHKHIKVGDKVVTSPSYLVLQGEEDAVKFNLASGLSDAEHPERKLPKKPQKAEKKQTEEKAKNA
jgi:small subunit ribosomal protein S4